RALRARDEPDHGLLLRGLPARAHQLPGRRAQQRRAAPGGGRARAGDGQERGRHPPRLRNTPPPPSLDRDLGREQRSFPNFAKLSEGAMQRRTFLKVGASAAGGAVALGFDLGTARAEMRELKISRTTETRS